ncbi:hypothetical protein Goklo_004385 [Gossypium klotzschianum]|uniref:Uncharacterized protein n=1 Tax=Gossypium klotzschianum TaxID=34286 RepID=A0A7J8VPJ4_9ROSI|nr:hypothetical protein [Gossypium klotzschianum]
MDGFESDDEDDDDADGSDKEMGVDAEEGDEADSIRLQKLAAQHSLVHMVVELIEPHKVQVHIVCDFGLVRLADSWAEDARLNHFVVPYTPFPLLLLFFAPAALFHYFFTFCQFIG